MTSRDFCYWLQGYLELTNEADEPKPPTPKQVQSIANHLGLVFKHEIDPSMGPPEHQKELNKVHTSKISSTDGFDKTTVMRC